MSYDREEFAERVRETAEDLPDEAVDAGLRGYLRETGEPYYQNEIADVLDLIRRHASRMADDDELAELLGLHVSGTVIKRDLLLERIDPKVEDLRRQLFDDSDPPFESLDDAADWLREEGGGEPELSEEDREKAQKILMAVRAGLDELSEIDTAFEADLSFNPQVWMPYWDPDSGGARRLLLTTGSSLRPLQQRTRALANETGFRWAEVVAYVLTGRRPELRTVEVTTETYGQYGEYGDQREISSKQYSRVILTLNSPDITFDQLREIWSRIQDSWHRLTGQEHMSRRPRPFDGDDELIWEVVRELGGPPDPPSKKSFWEEARGRCEDLGKEYEGWRGPMRKWQRLEERLEKRGYSVDHLGAG